MANESWQSAWVEVLPDFTDFAKNAKSKMTGILGPAGAAGGLAGGRLAGNLFKGTFLQILGGVLGANIITGIGYTIGRTVGNAIRAGLSYALGSVQLASDLNETTTAVGQVFGDAADAIISFADTADRKLGQTKQQALLAAQTFGIFAKSAGLTGKPLSTFTTGLVTLAGDLASFYNTSPADAIEAISAGLRGESEPLRRYGVLLDDLTLRNEAFALGIYKGKGPLTQQQRILAAQAVILKQTGIAQGDFARTSDGLANQQRILQSSLEDTQTKLGTALLPAFEGLAQYANDKLVPRLDNVIARIGPKLKDALEKSLPKIETFLDKVSPLVEKFIEWSVDGIPGVIDGLNDFADAAPGWIDFFKKINDAATGIFDHIAPTQDNVQAVNNFLGMPDGLAKKLGDEWSGLFKNLENAHDGFNAWVQGVIDSIVGFFTDVNKNVTDFQIGVGNAILGVIDWFAKLPLNVAVALGQVGKTLFTAGRDLIGGFIDGINSMLKPVGDAISAVMKFIAGFFPHSPAQRGPFSGAGWGQIAKSGRALADQFTSGFAPDLSGGLASRVSLAGIASGGALSAGLKPSSPAIYVQNPFTGEYLLAQVDGRAQSVVTQTVNRNFASTIGRKR